MNFVPYLVGFLFPALTAAGPYLWGNPGFLAAPILAFVIVPLLDLVLGRRHDNPTASEEGKRAGNRLYTIITWAFVPVQIALLSYGAIQFCSMQASLVERIGWIVTIGISNGGMGITIAHELGHRFNRFEQGLSLILLGTVFYGHWRTEHIAGHHRNVATPHDPATAKLGQSFYRFWWQTVLGTVKSAWLLEQKKQQRKGRNSIVFNHMLWIVTLQIAVAVGAGILVDPLITLFYFAQSFVAFTILELVNYVEHYGLQRRKLDDGRCEKVTPLHSWNNSNRVSNWFLINLQRHSDHHYKPGRRYQILRHMPQSPQLPAGYPTMILLALLPPLWRRVMDPRVKPYLASLS